MKRQPNCPPNGLLGFHKSKIIFFLISFIIGCASIYDPDKPYVFIKPQDGWIRLKVLPTNAVVMIEADRNQQIVKLLNDSAYRYTWFRRGGDDYLIYFQIHTYIDSESGCGDKLFEFKGLTNQWIPSPTNNLICVD